MPTSTPRRTPPPLAVALWVVLLALAASVTFTPIRSDNDCWWHVKTGKYIAENGIPRNDVFAFTAEDHKWDNHEWLSQWAMWHVWRLGDSTALGGWRAVIVLTTLVSMAAWAAVAFLARRRMGHWGLALLLAVVAVAIGRRTLYPRPPVVSYFFFTMFLWVCYEVRLGRWPLKRLWVLAPVTALWANLHGGWMAGIAALGMFTVDGFARHTVAWARELRGEKGPDGRPDPKTARTARATFHETRAWVLASMACVAASCLTPFGWRLYLLPGRVMSDLYLVRSIGELRSPDFFFTVAFAGALLFAVAALALVRRRPLTLTDVLLFTFWGYQGLQHVRHLPLFAIAATPLLAVVGREALRDLQLSFLGRQIGLRRWATGALTLAALALALYVARNPREGVSYFQRNRELLRGGPDAAYVENNFPARACDFVLLADIRGRMFNRNNYAGYLIWRLAPEHAKVFTDSRFDIFGGKFLRDENLIAMGNENPRFGPTWRELFDQYEIDWVLLPATEGLAERLEADDDWERVFYDTTAATPWMIWIQATEETRPMRERARRVFHSTTGMQPDAR